MIWKWLRKKLGIVDYSDEIIDINSKLYLNLKFQSNVLADLYTLKESSAEMQKFLIELDKKVNSIPKEMVVKNVLSI